MAQASRCQYIYWAPTHMYNKQIKLYSGVKSRPARSNLDYSRMQGSLLHRRRLDTDISETLYHTALLSRPRDNLSGPISKNAACDSSVSMAAAQTPR